MSGKNRKIPKYLTYPIESKTPKVASFPSDQCHPEFNANQMDIKGPWGWNNIDSTQIQEIFQKIFETLKLTWQELRNNGSHMVSVKDLCPTAVKRLTEIQKEDVDELFSLRLSGTKRIWGIKDRNIFWLLWWDPNHQVCPSKKKHT